jgi:mono/diheme cytochrome c family protein
LEGEIMSLRALVPFLAVLLGLATVLLNSQTIKKTTVTPTSPASGQQMFSEYCAVCHGTEGRGDGPAATALKKRPADLTMMTTKNNGKFPDTKIYAAIRGDVDLPAHGSKDMPVWGNVFNSMSRGSSSEVQMRIANLTRYVEGLQTR